MAVSGDMAVAPAVTGHGAAILAIDVAELPLESTFSAVLDTETLRLSYTDLRLADGVFLGAYGEGEFGFAGLFPDYFQDGRRIAERGFDASYLGGGGGFTFSPHRAHWIRANVGVRRWFFVENDTTSDALILPRDATIVAPSLGYTCWRVRNASGYRERQRAYPRVEGGAFGLQVSAWSRSNDAAWGATDPSFDPIDTRNDPDPVAIRGQAWLVGGAWLGDSVRWQFDHRAAYGNGEDDLTRDRIGGLNRYVVPVAGAPWGSWVSERYLSGQWSWHFPVVASHELGLLLTSAYVDDAGRTGDSESGLLFGAGAFADLRWGAWQLDLRAGWTPTLEPDDEDDDSDANGPPGAGVAFGFGWSG